MLLIEEKVLRIFIIQITKSQKFKKIISNEKTDSKIQLAEGQ